MQETCLAALCRPPREPGARRAWLARVVRNFALRARIADARRRAREERVSRPERDDDSPDRVLERAELHRAVVGAVLELAEPLRSTVLLRFFDGRSTAEIARSDGVHAATVRWRLRKSLELLRERLDREHGGRRSTWHGILLPLALSPAFPAGGAATAAASAGNPSSTLLSAGGIFTVSLKKVAATLAASIVLLAVGVLVVRHVLSPDSSLPAETIAATAAPASRCGAR